MPRNWNTIMHIFMKSETCFYQFFALEAVVLIQKCSLMPWECNRIVLLPWNALEWCFQFWNFLEKVQSLFMVLGAASRSLCIRFWSVYVWDGLGLRFESRDQCNHESNIGFLMAYFFNLFPCILIPIMSKPSNFGYARILSL